MDLFSDVDGTLLLYGKDGVRFPNRPLIAAIKSWQEAHPFDHVTVWSRAGLAHARMAARLIPGARVAVKDYRVLRPNDVAVDDAKLGVPSQVITPQAFVRGS